MNTATLIYLCVVVVGVTHCAGPIKGTERCICTGTPMKRVHLKRMLTIETFSASPFCSKIEILATVKKTGKKLCLDPRGKQGKRFLNNKRTLTQMKNPKKKRGKKKRRN
ncbi:hypothetical protein SKAU_G00012790 [Synaphobranchus kaupii]|uniref:Chemokine interleukin-8-like domain-containing protein n=1 Tax=Synaphobranchus kaupii TaxID=118154 RepID=A0A9Q1JBE3_SYNKA|nr:hypothetical protein SKAU_G00012790 [Synaphobranchus kaupii]